ncbi:MAG: alpha-ribazole phosphatase family protein, partial [Promethearchaeota archaeon]
MEIYLIRHPITKVGNKVCYGKADVEPIDDYINNVSRIMEFVKPDKRTLLYSSPSTRCLKVAEYIKESSPIEKDPIIDNRIMEMNFGNWELKAWADIDKKEFSEWAEDFVNRRPPNGESYKELLLRVEDFFDEIKLKYLKNDFKKENIEKIIIITHGGVIRAILRQILGYPPENSFIIEIDYCSTTKITIKKYPNRPPTKNKEDLSKIKIKNSLKEQNSANLKGIKDIG